MVHKFNSATINKEIGVPLILNLCSAPGHVTKKPDSRKIALTLNQRDVVRESLSNRAYQQIRDEILSGELSIGDALSRRQLAKRLNMSFLPITEALKCLETEGLVESRSRIGTRVRIPSEQDIRDSNVIREALESQAARLCAQNMTAEEKKNLHKRARHMDKLHKMCAQESENSQLLFSVHNYHLQFHMRIAELARCPGLSRAIEKEQVLIFNWLFDIAARRRTQPEEFHTTLAEALCSGDPLAADKAMRAHVRYGLDQVLERLGSYRGRDTWRSK